MKFCRFCYKPENAVVEEHKTYMTKEKRHNLKIGYPVSKITNHFPEKSIILSSYLIRQFIKKLSCFP